MNHSKEVLWNNLTDATSKVRIKILILNKTQTIVQLANSSPFSNKPELSKFQKLPKMTWEN